MTVTDNLTLSTVGNSIFNFPGGDLLDAIILDDNPETANKLMDMFQDAGLTSTVFEECSIAIAAVKSLQPKIFVLRYHLKGLDDPLALIEGISNLAEQVWVLVDGAHERDEIIQSLVHGAKECLCVNTIPLFAAKLEAYKQIKKKQAIISERRINQLLNLG